MIIKNHYLTVIALISLVFSTTGQALALDNGPEKIDINTQLKHPKLITKNDKRHLPDFPHHMHQDEFLAGNVEYAYFEYEDDYTCTACHHTNKAGEQPVACLKCKDVNKMLDKVGGAEKFENIYHKNCRDGCHKKMKKVGIESGPTKCKGCHL